MSKFNKNILSLQAAYKTIDLFVYVSFPTFVHEKK